MTLRRTGRLLVTHWIVTALALLATMAAGTILAGRLHKQYEATGAVIVLAPGRGEDTRGNLVPVNPFAALGSDGQVITAHVLVRLLTTDAFHASFLAASGVSDYRIDFQPDGGGSIINVTITGGSPSVTNALGRLTEAASQQLAQAQSVAGAPPNSRFTLQALTKPSAPTTLSSGRVKVLSVTAGLGVGAIVGLVYLAEYFSVLSRRRRPGQFEEWPGERGGLVASDPIAAKVPASANSREEIG